MTKKQSPEVLPEVLPAESATGLQLAVYDGPEMGVVSMDDLTMIRDSLSVDTTEWKLPRIKLPTGDGGAFVADVLGSPVAVPSFVGTIVGIRHAANAWWRTLGTTAGSFPDCKSDDGITGTGNPDLKNADAAPGVHACGVCPHNKLGTKRLPGGGRGKGKDCKNTAILLVAMPGDLLPTTLVVTPGSLGNWGAYKMALLSKHLRVTDIVTEFGLESATSDGTAYKKITFKAVGRAAESPLAADTRAYFAAFLNRQKVIEAVSSVVSEEVAP